MSKHWRPWNTCAHCGAEIPIEDFNTGTAHFCDSDDKRICTCAKCKREMRGEEQEVPE